MMKYPMYMGDHTICFSVQVRYATTPGYRN